MTIILHHEKCEPFGRAFYVSSIVVFSTLTARYIIASRNREPVLRDVTVEKVRKRGKRYLNRGYIFRIPRAQGAWLYSWFPWTPSVPPLDSVKALRARPPALAYSHFEAFLRPPPSLLPLIPSPTLHLPHCSVCY